MTNIVFFEEHFQNEFIPGLFTSPSLRNEKVIKEINLFNAQKLILKLKKTILLFLI